MRQCDSNITKLRDDNKQRDAEIERKRQQLKILQAKKVRIEKEKKAVQQYETFLENVKGQGDEYQEVIEIRQRHLTLKKSTNELIENLKNMSDQVEGKKTELASY